MNQEMTELINKIKANDIDKVKELLPKVKKKDLDDYYSINLPGLHDFEFISAAIAALHTLNPEMVNLLLKYNVDFKYPDPSGRGPTAYAMLQGYSKIFEIVDNYYADQEGHIQNLTGDKTETD